MKVEPIRNVKDIRLIKKLLADRPRDLAIFCVGINSALRASEILMLTVGHARTVKPGKDIVIVEKKTGKERTITANHEVAKVLLDLYEHRRKTDKKLADDAPLFVGQRGPLRVPTICKLIKTLCKEINLDGNYSSHSMRKSFGFHCRTRLGMDISELMMIYGHSAPSITLRYLGIQPDEIRNRYMSLKY